MCSGEVLGSQFSVLGRGAMIEQGRSVLSRSALTARSRKPVVSIPWSIQTLVLVSNVMLTGCGGGQPQMDKADARPTIAVEYISAPQLKIHVKPDDASPVISTYGNGESVSVLARKGSWVEVRTGTGTGWAKASDLRTADAETHEPDSLTPRFLKPPSPITQTTTKGEIVLEADVNTDGDVTAIRTESNTTGSAALHT